VNSGNRRFLPALILCATLYAANAGRPGESGTGAIWIAPELLESRHDVQPCRQLTTVDAPDPVFEMLEAETADLDGPQLADSAREVVAFEWNPATGELSYSATATTRVFSDLGYATLASAAAFRNCGSR
jgi:hypothetical protein